MFYDCKWIKTHQRKFNKCREQLKIQIEIYAKLLKLKKLTRLQYLSIECVVIFLYAVTQKIKKIVIMLRYKIIVYCNFLIYSVMAKKIDYIKLLMECIKFMLLREILILKYDGCVKFSTAKTTHNLYIIIIINCSYILQQKIKLQFMRNLCNKFVQQLCMRKSIMLKYLHQ